MKNFIHKTALFILLVSFIAAISSFSILPPKTDYSNVQNITITLLASTHCLNDTFMKEDPYKVNQTEAMMNRNGFCAVKFVPGTLEYYLRTFETEAQANAEGWKITHKDKCGACSTLRDLAVYLHHRDLTAPVRKIAAIGFISSWFFEGMDNLGFTEDCAKIWYYNSKNTARECLGTCMLSWVKGEASNNQDGSLNECLYCDEVKSGPIFQRYAGRTRRNSGIISSIGRYECDVYDMHHHYFDIKTL